MSIHYFTRAAPMPDEPAMAGSIQGRIGQSDVVISSPGATASPYTVMVSKLTDWTDQEITDVQTLIAAAGTGTPRSRVYRNLDVAGLPLFYKAVLLVLLDEVNVLRQQLGLAPRTVQQAVNAVRTKAGDLAT